MKYYGYLLKFYEVVHTK